MKESPLGRGQLRLLSVAVVAATLAWVAAQVSFAAGANNRGTLAAYVWADQPANKSYSPADNYFFSLTRQPAAITHPAVGVYSVKFPGVGTPGGHAQVTAYGAGAHYCKIASWSAAGSDQVVNVNCFGGNGAPADVQFALAFFQ